VNWLIRNGYVESVGQWIYNKQLDTWKRYDDCYIMRDIHAFSRKIKPTDDSVVQIKEKKDRCSVNLHYGSPIEAKTVVLATGAWTDKLLKDSSLDPIGVEGLGGRALIVEPSDKVIRKRIEWAKEVISVSVRPFKNYDLLANQTNWWYFGATTEKDESEKSYAEMIGAAKLVLGENVKIKETLFGVRPIYNGGVRRVSDRVIAATGGGRIGLAIAGPAADDVVRLIRENE
jgi:glycine/D-amino acid oxidase-like deaminating enzyme